MLLSLIYLINIFTHFINKEIKSQNGSLMYLESQFLGVLGQAFAPGSWFSYTLSSPPPSSGARQDHFGVLLCLCACQQVPTSRIWWQLHKSIHQFISICGIFTTCNLGRSWGDGLQPPGISEVSKWWAPQRETRGPCCCLVSPTHLQGFESQIASPTTLLWLLFASLKDYFKDYFVSLPKR